MARGPYRTFHPRRLLASLAAAAVLIPVLALVVKTLVEATTPLVYEIHWLETVPLLIALFALVINGAWNERAARREAAAPPATPPRG